MCRYVMIVASAVLAPAYGWTFMVPVAKVFRNQSFRDCTYTARQTTLASWRA